MASEICMNCFSVKGQYEVCPYCGYVEGTPPKQPHYLTPGTIIGGHFIVGTVIGVGGFGITYKCFDYTLGLIVAVKEFYPVGLVNRSPGETRVGLLSGDKGVQYKEQLKRFLMEARSIAQFGNAKDIVNVYDFFEENGTAYIIMEYIDGVLLKDYLDKQGRMSPAAARAIIMPIIEAVKKIHSKGIIHQDISPDNIFLLDEHTIKVFDFGAARLNDTKEGAGEKVIKVGYSAPEQYRDKSRQGFFTDVYSVGAIMYQMLTGRKPMESTEREHKDTLKSPLELGVKISKNEDKAIMEAMAVQPELRYQGIQQFEDNLRNKGIAQYPKDKIRNRRRMRNGIIGSAVVVALAVGVGIGLYFTVYKDKSDEFYKIDVAKGTEVTIWVENTQQQSEVEELADFGKISEEQNAGSIKDMLDILEEATTVTVEAHPKMEEDLKTAAQEGTLPDMFISDDVSNLDDYKLVDLQDTVYKELDTDNYCFLGQYETYYPEKTAMPTGLDTLLLYQLKFGYNKDKKLGDSEITSDSDGLVAITDVIPEMSADQKLDETVTNKGAYFTLSDNSIADAMLLMKNAAAKNEDADQIVRDSLTNILTYNSKISSKKYRVGKTKSKGSVYGSNVAAGVTYRSGLETVKGDEVKNTSANPLTDYDVSVLSYQGKILVSFAECYSISDNSSEDQKTVCERLLWLMLNGVGQDKKAASQRNTSFPIMKSSINNFVKYNPKFGQLATLVNKEYPCILVGSRTTSGDGTANTGLVNALNTTSLIKAKKDDISDATVDEILNGLFSAGSGS